MISNGSPKVRILNTKENPQFNYILSMIPFVYKWTLQILGITYLHHNIKNESQSKETNPCWQQLFSSP